MIMKVFEEIKSWNHFLFGLDRGVIHDRKTREAFSVFLAPSVLYCSKERRVLSSCFFFGLCLRGKQDVVSAMKKEAP